MLLDVRTKMQTGTINTHLKLYSEKGKPAQSKHLGQPLLFATTETGNPNEYTHIWVYKNADDREKKEQLCGLTQIGLITLKKAQN